MDIDIIVIVIGISMIAIGIYRLKNAKTAQTKKTAVNKRQTTDNKATKHDKKNEIKEKIAAIPPIEKALIFESLIKIAMNDGILAEKEKGFLQRKAMELGLNYADFLKQVNELLQATKNESQFTDKNKEKGDEFEKFIAKKFDRKFFTIEQWTSDKYVDGIYAQTNMHPDLQMSFKHKENKFFFAIECKYRSDYFKNGIEWCKENQLKNYQNFAIEKQMPVFIALGVGGNAHDPNELYIINLSLIESTFLTKDFLMKYKKYNFKEKNFFFDPITQILK